MTDAVKVAVAQIDLIVGDVAGNTGLFASVVDVARFARAWLRRELAPADEEGGGDGA